MMRERKTTQVVIRLTETERARIEQMAEIEGLDMSNYIRWLIKRTLDSKTQITPNQVS